MAHSNQAERLTQCAGVAAIIALALMSTAAPPATAADDGGVNLAITQTVSGSALGSRGGQAMFTLVVRNDGPADATGVTVKDPLRRMSPIAVHPSQGSCSRRGNVLSCVLGSLVAGGSAQVLIETDIPARPSRYRNVVAVGGDQPELDRNDNEHRVTFRSLRADPFGRSSGGYADESDLVIDKRSSATQVAIGQQVGYTTVVSNDGPDPARRVRITDTLNAPATVVSVASTAGACSHALPMTCSLGRITVGESVRITVVLRHERQGCWQQSTASTISGNGGRGVGTDADTSDNVDTVGACERDVDLALSTTSSRSTVRAGSTFRYRLRVRNRSDRAIHGVRMCDRLPSGLVFVSSVFVSSRPTGAVLRGERCWEVDRLEGQSSYALRVTVRALPRAHGRKVNRVTTTSTETTRVRAERAIRVVGRAVRSGGVSVRAS